MKSSTRILVLITSLCIVISSVPALAVSPPKPGKACTKAGITQTHNGKKFTCVKRAKTLVWNAGVVITKSSVLNNPSAPKTIKTKEILFIENELAKISTSLNQFKVPQYFVEVEPVDQSSIWARAAVKDLNTGISFVQALGGELPRIPNLLIFSDFDWAKVRMSGTCLNWGMNSLGGQCASDVAFINLGWLKSRGYKPNEIKDPWLKINLSSVLPGRLAHIAQSEVFYKRTGNYGTGDLNSIPAWMLAGKIQIFMVMNYSISTNTPYSIARADWVKSWDGRCKNTSLFELSESRPYESGCENINGFLAMELLLSKSNDLTAFYWWESKASGEVSEGFRKSYSLDWESFIKEADQYVKNNSL